MKDNILIFIIGVLLGACIATGAFFVYSTTNNTCNNNQTMEMGGASQGQMGEPPEKPDGDNGQPPEKPGENNQQNNDNGE